MNDLYEKIYLFFWFHYMTLVQKVYGEHRLGWCEACEGPRPTDLRARIAGWMMGKRYF